MRSLVIAAVVGWGCLFGAVSELAAERSAPQWFQRSSETLFAVAFDKETDKAVVLAAVSRVEGTVPGIFVAALKNPEEEFQSFSADDLKADVSSLFIATTPVGNYSELYHSAGASRSRRAHKVFIRRNSAAQIALETGSATKVVIDFNDLFKYLSILVQNDKGSALIGFLGTDLKLNVNDEERVSLLQANAVFKLDEKNLVKPYRISEDRLFIGKRKIDPSKVKVIGVHLGTPEHPCLSGGKRVLYTTRTNLDELRSKSPQDRVDAVRAALNDRKYPKQIENGVVINVTESSVVVYEPKTPTVLALKPIRRGSGSESICVVNEFPLN